MHMHGTSIFVVIPVTRAEARFDEQMSAPEASEGADPSGIGRCGRIGWAIIIQHVLAGLFGPIARRSWGNCMTNAHTLDEFDEQDEPRGSDGRGMWNVLAIAVVVIIIILALLMLRGCDTILNSANHSSATNQIIPVTGASPIDGKVSIWLAPGASISRVLASDGLTGTFVNMGAGRYVLDVPVGSEVEAARKLRDDSNVYDAGRVYRDSGK